MRLSETWFCIFASVALGLFGLVSFWRDSATGGPHHDEVIALMAAKGMEREWVRMASASETPLHEIVQASDWHRFTRNFTPVNFSEIRQDVMAWDKHPPLAFWVLNRWLSLIPNSSYPHAVVLMWIQLVIAAVLLGVTAFRCSGSSSVGLTAFGVFLMGNSTIFTAIWVRQYGLFMAFFAVLVFAAAEITRKNISYRAFTLWSVVIGAASLFGMMCQYTFSTMTGPVHLAIICLLVSRRKWAEFIWLIGVYIVAGLLFFACLPGVLEHASAVSGGLERRWQLYDALKGMPRMFVPVPSALPPVVIAISGAIALLAPLGIAAWLIRQASVDNSSSDRPDVRVPLAGMLGAGVLQFSLVALGIFPGWATGENHMCAFWLLTVLAIVLCLSFISSARTRGIVVVVSFAMMLGMQTLFIWHCHRILPKVNTSYIRSMPHNLVIGDNTARGFVLQITDLMQPDQKILVADSNRVVSMLSDGSLHKFESILYLPMDETVRDGKSSVLNAAVSGGWTVRDLPVVHVGMYEAFLLSRTAQ